MTPLSTAALVCTCIAAAVAAFVHGARRSPRSLAAVRARMYGPSAPGAGTVGGAPARLFEAVAIGPVGGSIDRRFGVGLNVVGWSAADVVSRVLVGAALGMFTVVFSVAALTAAGLLPLSPLWLVVAALVAGMAAWVMWSDVDTRIQRRRRELRQAANDLVQLVAVGLTTDQSVEEAVRFALAVGSSEAFDLVRRELDAAPQRGIPLWEALDSMGRAYGIRELSEFGASIERQGLHGVSIAETVATLAATMRATALDELERDADKANANLAGPTIGFVVATIVFLAYPLALRVGEAFGG